MVATLIFIVLIAIATTTFGLTVRKIYRVIRLGKSEQRWDMPKQRLLTMLRVAFAQGKMGKRPLAGFLHVFVYVGFVIINLEVFEIVLDGMLGTHRIMAPQMGSAYPIFINSFELLAGAVLLSSVVFLARRNLLNTARLQGEEIGRWQRIDANIILLAEVVLVSVFLCMNAADGLLHARGVAPYSAVGQAAYWVSGWLQALLSGFSTRQLILFERTCWWFHIVGIMGFLNYIPYSKHLHVFFAFPNVFFSKLSAPGKTDVMPSVQHELQIMLGLLEDTPEAEEEPASFGAKDLTDLSWKQIHDAYTCTECGRCTDLCPASATGKLLSPRKIVMDVRHSANALGKLLGQADKDDCTHQNLHQLISPNEIWACTSCNQCTETCPLNIDQLSVIIDLRRYLVMEESSAPSSLNTMFANIENNGAPWQLPQDDRAQWTENLFA